MISIPLTEKGMLVNFPTTTIGQFTFCAEIEKEYITFPGPTECVVSIMNGYSLKVRIRRGEEVEESKIGLGNLELMDVLIEEAYKQTRADVIALVEDMTGGGLDPEDEEKQLCCLYEWDEY